MERLDKELRERITALRFTSARFRFALIKEDDEWKIYAMRVIFDSTGYSGKSEVLLKEDNFVLEDYWMDIDQFYAFMEYLKTVDVTKFTFTPNKTKLTEENYFTLGQHSLAFVGNFPGGQFDFFNSEIAKRYGIDRSAYYNHYYFHDSMRPRTDQNIILTHHDPPFRDIPEALNYYWNTRFDRSSIRSAQLDFYLPLLDGSIKNCTLKDNMLEVELDIDHKRTSYNELSLAVIAQGTGGPYRKKHKILGDKLRIDLGFEPERYSVVLNKGTKLLDEYSYYSSQPEPVLQSDAVDRYLESHPRIRKHVIFVDAGYRKGKGGHIGWFNETTGDIYESPNDCADSFRCEYAAIIHALENIKDYRLGEEIEIRCDNLGVVKQLNHEYALNNDDIRGFAMTIWKEVAEKFHGKVKFMFIPREANKAGKLLGS